MMNSPNAIQPVMTAAYPSAAISSLGIQRESPYPALNMALTTPPEPQLPGRLKLQDWLLHPMESYQLSQKLRTSLQKGESYTQRLAMYQALKKQLSVQGQQHLYQQLIRGRLTDTNADNNRSTLAHLYSIIATPRTSGLQANAILEETLRLLSEPQTITQKFGTLTPESLRQLMQYYKSGLGPKIAPNVDILGTLRDAHSATCVAASVMYYMINRQPSEFVRHISSLTGPAQAFYEKAWLDEISPENPALAAQRLTDYGIPATLIPGSHGAQYWIKVDLPYSGLIRAINQQGLRENGTQGVVEAAYQAALIHLAERSYDPGLDMRVNPDGTLDYNKGLDAERKTLMESIIKDNGGVMCVTYQFTVVGRDEEPYLMGYYRNFQQTTKDLTDALDQGEYVLIGIVTTDRDTTAGRLNMKHEVTVVGYERDKKTGEIMFILADSDDDNPVLVKRSARELIPQIHHAGLPVKMAQKILAQMNAKPENQYLIPDQADAKRFHVIPTVPPNQHQAFIAEYEKIIQEENAKQVQQQPQPAPQQRVAQPAVPMPSIAYYAYPGAAYRPQPIMPVSAYPIPAYQVYYWPRQPQVLPTAHPAYRISPMVYTAPLVPSWQRVA